MHVTAYSKEVCPGSIYFALKGAKFDGHDFIADVLARGAAKVYSERPYPDARVEALGNGARKKLGELASEMYGHPSRRLKMIGVTGTSGKTTTTYLIQHLLRSAGHRCARLGTNGGEFEGQSMETANTTPDAISLHRWFAEVLARGATHVVMEVSSHSLDQDRAWGITWDVAVFLNLSHEHLDYHPTLEDYFTAKEKLFTDHARYSRAQGKQPVLLTRADHEFGRRILAHEGAQGYSVRDDLRDGRLSLPGASPLPFTCPLYGAFQSENILAASRAVVALGVPPAQVCAGLATFPGVPGRMEEVQNDLGIRVFVDYAHKPEALEKVLESIAQSAGGMPVITVFGCGGDRDRTKRPVMGKIAARLSTRVIVTSDNPRTEDPAAILREVEAGMAGYDNYRVIEDRREAIRTAIAEARPGNIVLIAGKGHEDYQIIGTTKRHFDDRLEARAALEARGRGDR